MKLTRCVACPSRTIFGLVVSLALLFPASFIAAHRWDSQGAAAAFKLAREKRAEIAATAKPTLDQYLDCAKTYRKVHGKDPHYGRTGDAIYEEALIYQEAAEKFSKPEYFKTAAARFRLLVKEYGGTASCRDALVRLGFIYSKRLDDQTAADEVYRSLQSQYRYSAEAIKRIRNESPVPPARPEPAAVQEKPELPKAQAPSETSPGSLSTVQSIRFWSTNDYTRVLIDMDSDARYTKEQLHNPDRVYFDIANSKISRDLNRDIRLTDGIVKQIRLATNRANVVRIVLDTTETGDFSVSEMHDPFRIVVDLRKKGSPAPAAAEPNPSSAVRPPEITTSKPGPPPQAVTELKPAAPKSSFPAKSNEVPNGGKDKPAAPPIVESPAMVAESKSLKPPSVTDIPPPITTPAKPARVATSAEGDTAAATRQGDKLPPSNQAPPARMAPSAPLKAEPAHAGASEPGPVDSRTSTARLDPDVKSSKPKTPLVPKQDSLPLPKQSEPTSKGDRTLTRMLGLKVGRIVIDPGHGGHDQGSIGPGGLLEKDLVLSIAQSLGKMLEEKLGAEVVLTRQDDTFVPLEERTAIANQHKADLFVSIHANSSRIRSISGVETYYLDFAKTDSEREIAARENATSANNVRDLEDLIKKIAQADKSSESRELASILQKKLFSGVRQVIPLSNNRGVRSAPFIVLIGANMPSVLAEVSFISNPKDEKLLKKDAFRQTLVRALFSGIDGYMKTLGSDVVHNQAASQGK